MKNKGALTFDEYKKTLDALYQELLVALRENDNNAKSRILRDKDRVKKHFERAFGKNATHRDREIHISHRLTKWNSETLAPTGGVFLVYEMRYCDRCNAGEAHHSSGHFVDKELYKPCAGDLK